MADAVTEQFDKHYGAEDAAKAFDRHFRARRLKSPNPNAKPISPSFLVGMAKGAGRAAISPFTEAARTLGEMYPELHQVLPLPEPSPPLPPGLPGAKQIGLGLAQNVYVPTPIGPVSPVGLGMSVREAATAGRPVGGQPPTPEQVGERIGAAGVGAFFSAPGAPRTVGARILGPKAPVMASEAAAGPVERVLETIKAAEPLRSKQESLYSQERAQRAAKATAAGQQVKGEKGFYAELSQLAGEHTRVPWAAREKMAQTDVDHLFRMAAESPKLQYFETVSARNGLQKLLGFGELPTHSELALLEKVFGEKFVTQVLQHRPTLQRMKELGYEIANVPRAVMASYDLSAPMRQGLFLGAAYPGHFAKAFGGMFRQFGSEKFFKASMEEIASRPTYQLMKQSGLSLTELGRYASAREEVFIGGGLAEKIPIAGRGIRASNRAYSGFLNKLRADSFDSLVRDAREMGRDPAADPALGKAIAQFVNAASGRGGGRFLAEHMTGLNALFFSPRFISSRLELMNPRLYISSDPVIRKAALRGALTLGSAGITILSLAKLSGANVETDPRKADFGKIRVGDTRYDIWGGFQQFMRFAVTMAMGPERGTRWDTASRFAESKTAPLVSFGIDALRGKNMVGQQFNLDREVLNRFVPMAAADAYDLVKERAAIGAPMALPGVFGVGIQTYKTKQTEEKGKK